VNIPDETAALWAFYKFRRSDLAGFGFGGGVRYVSSSFGDNTNTLVVPDYTLFDLAAQYDFGKRWANLDGVKIQFNVANLLDREYVSQCSSEVNCLYGNGRTFITSVKYQW
jgi:iron complex outermembrane receptor protein